MCYIKHISTLLIATIFVLPLAAQQSSKPKVRMDTTRTVFRDTYGNIIGEAFEWRMEGSFESPKENLKSRKVSYFSNRIGFTTREAERFWPVYNEYSEKLDILKLEQRKLLSQFPNCEMMTEKEIKALLDAYVNSYAQESTLLQEYHKKFSAILPPSKVVRLYQAEDEFRKWLIDLLRYGR
jgi:hypothetical protein